MTIQIKYMVNLRDRVGTPQERVTFSQGSTLQDVANWLHNRYQFSLPDSKIMAILNGKGWTQYPKQFATQIHDGDVICLFPPIGGG